MLRNHRLVGDGARRITAYIISYSDADLVIIKQKSPLEIYNLEIYCIILSTALVTVYGFAVRVTNSNSNSNSDYWKLPKATGIC